MAKRAKEQPTRTFLVIVDRTEELKVALRYACRRASHTGGRVSLLWVIEPPEGMGWMAVEQLAQSEGRQEAEEKLQELSAKVVEWTGQMPTIHIREGRPLDQLLKLIEEEPTISILVLGADAGPKGPGPLVTALSGKHMAKLRIPLTIVPGNLTDEQIDTLT
ncbi:MAG TPA: universal stress protein [Alphaproteobacteria bacterium]|jgi:nucleotide-binding universal stress UspA family protein